ncbi:MAG: ABC transporter substrate-binding protein [Prevotellaceae bacterium]|nr:ABC transporter substrate-binding protein [Prevotellaceae bacterium]
MLQNFVRFALCAMLFFAVSCNRKPHNRVETDAVDSLKIEFARGFSVAFHAGYKSVRVKNFRNINAPENRYYLVKDANTETPPDGVKVQIPLQRLAACSATFYEFLQLLGEIESVVAVANGDIAYNQIIRDGITAGSIANLGDALSINVETALALQPSALMTSGYNTADTHAERVEKAGIPLIINNEWQESSILGRAEWLKFIAAFYDKEQFADSIFAEIVTRYQSAKNAAVQADVKPTVMSGANFRGTWYMPGGQSFMAQLFSDAGADYFYKNDKSAASLPLNFETVLKNFADSDFWVNCDYVSFAQMRSTDEKNMLFKPAGEGNVWNFNKRTLPNGANDFWESGLAHPDLLLKDLIKIFHNNLLPDYELTYAKKLD